MGRLDPSQIKLAKQSGPKYVAKIEEKFTVVHNIFNIYFDHTLSKRKIKRRVKKKEPGYQISYVKKKKN